MESVISRRSVLAGLIFAGLANTIGKLGNAFAAPNQNIILGRPTSNSIAVSVMTDSATTAYIEYGLTGKTFPGKSMSLTINPNTPVVFDLKNLKSNTKYFYRLRYKAGNVTATGKVLNFQTARASGTPFAFSIHGDTHPERAGKMFNSELYYVTMANVASQKTDFHILMGDDFSIDPLIGKGQATQANVENIYRTQRDWLRVIGQTTPIFLVNGNHEQAAQYLLDGTTTSPAVLAGNARNKYYALPAPDNFYTGDNLDVPGIGKLRDYYSWTWGDAQFITLDPYWHSKYVVDNVAGNSADQASGKKAGDNGKTKDLWQVGIGDEQYAWLKQTLESSKSKYIFVFAHHVMGTGRGAIEVSTDYEWGGRDPKGMTTFKEQRPNWELPIHDLMVKHKVSIFFQGHDHIFVTQERDGLIYQSMPNPADDTFSMFNEAAYTSGTKAPNSGHVRVNVSSASAKVEYFLAARMKDVARKNLTLAHSYEVKPRSI